MFATALGWAISSIWEEKQILDKCIEGVVYPIYQKGDTLECWNYRGITLKNAACEILSLVLYHRVSPLTRRFVGQYLYYHELNLIDPTDSTKMSRVQCVRLIVFIDLMAAYDTVGQEQLMHENGLPDQLTWLIRATINRGMCYVRVPGSFSSLFMQCHALECVFQSVGIDPSGTIFTKSMQLLEFADDFNIIAGWWWGKHTPDIHFEFS